MSRSLDNGTARGPWERVDHGIATDALLSPEASLERITRVFERVRGVVGSSRAELYHRASFRLRVRLDASDAREIIETGHDEGLAARVRTGGGRVGFAAVSGGEIEDAQWALSEAASRETTVAKSSWADHSGAPIIDCDPTVCPDPAALRTTLRRSLSRSGETCPDSPPTWAGSWIEWGTTVESWVADGGFRASRSRSRAWAMTPKRLAPEHGGGEIPALIAARGLDELGRFGWIAPALHGTAVPLDAALSDGTLLLEPFAAALVVRALAVELCAPGRTTRQEVGPGFRISDDPAHPKGLTGGKFDDAGFPTIRKPLADGSRILALFEGRGHLRRSSFRDPPAPDLTTLVVEGGGETPPKTVIHIPEARLHVLAPGDWVLEPVGAWLGDAGSGKPIARSFLRVSPHEIARRLHATAGPATLSPNNTQTPALILDRIGASS
ncbi:MAG: hypothetical protein R3344_02575 [Acidobacteriota bacterium]|nr:hypothetical protein [Acidobacteriota bacterium]